MNELIQFLYNPPGVLWIAAGTLIALIIIHRVREQINPLVGSLVVGLSEQAKNNAADIGRAMLFGLSASLAAWYDCFSQVDAATMHAMSAWQLSALFAKVANPFIVAFLATLVKSSDKIPPSPKVITAPPFPTPPASP